MFSIVIPLHNKEETIRRTLASVMAQDFKNFEVLIINDGSTDASCSIIESFKDDNIKIFSTQQQGVAAARNRGVVEAKYPYIAFLDADDWWAPSYLFNQAASIAKFPNEKIFATGRTHVFPSHTWRYASDFLPTEGEREVVNLFPILANSVPPIHSSCTVIAKSIFDAETPFTEGMHQYEDHELWLRLALKNKIVYFNEPLSFYNKTATTGASSQLLLAKDFLQMVSTITRIAEALPAQYEKDFQKYYQRFIMHSYLKYAHLYSKKERNLLYGIIKPLLFKWQRWLLVGLVGIPFRILYRMVAKKPSDGI